MQKVELLKLAGGPKREQHVGFTLTKIGDNQKVKCLLYKDAMVDTSLSLKLWIDVK